LLLVITISFALLCLLIATVLFLQSRNSRKQQQEKDELFKLLADNSHDLICLHNRDSTYRFVSPSVKKILGYNPEELIGRNPYELLHPEDKAKIGNSARKKSLAGEENRIEHRFLKKNGDYIWMESYSKPLLENSDVKMIQTTSRDITFKKEVDNRLAESEKKYRLIAETSNDVIIVFDADANPIFVSPSVKNALGYEVEEFLEQRPFENIHPDDRLTLKNLRRVFEQGQKVEGLNFRLASKDGNYVWLEGYYTPIVNNGKLEKVHVSLRDISLRKRALQRLAESEELYRLLASNSHDLVCLHEPDGTYRYVSPSVMPLLGYQPDELIGQNPYDFFHPSDKEWIAENPHRQTLEGKSIVNIEYRFRKKDGSYVWLETYTSPVMKDGVVTSFQTSSRDVTERKLLEESLQLAKEKAERASSYKSEFLSSMSHEIRTPLNAIVGLSDLLLTREPKEDQIKIFKMLKSSGDHLLTMVNSVLDFSKIEAGKMETEVVAFHLPDLLYEVVALFSEKANSKNLSLNLQADNIPTMMTNDSAKLKQVISNLISNALKFTSAGSVTVSANFDKQTDSVQFMVKDTGIGIDTAGFEKIFRSFEQANEQTTRQYGGTGLGLPISQKLVDLMGGKLEVSSKEGQGSSFFFSLPVTAGMYN
jgi:PAS domain S-box-containing protein